MKFINGEADIHVPDGSDPQEALARTTMMGVGAHQDDNEIMAYGAIAACYLSPEEWFTGVVLTDGGGSPRSGIYANYSNHEIHIKRSQEQREAADCGKYSAVVQLAYNSADVRRDKREVIEEELASLFALARPRVVFVHSPLDRHETHLAAGLRAIGALRRLPRNERPQRVYGMEVWRSLDWLSSADRVVFDTSAHPEVARGVIAAYETQCTPRKRFDLATLGRRMGNATFLEPWEVDATDSCAFGMDLTPLIQDDDLSIREYALGFIRRFYADAEGLLNQLL